MRKLAYLSTLRLRLSTNLRHRGNPRWLTTPTCEFVNIERNALSLLEPDKYFSRISHIDIQRDLLSCGLTNVLLDIDNTILARDTRTIPRDVGVWMGKARDAGIKLCLVSNSWQQDVLGIAESIELPIVVKSMKPLPQGYLMGMRKLGSKRKSTVMVGDQIATDVLGAHLVGMKVYMVQPLVEQDLPHTLMLRNFERVILGDRAPEPLTPACKNIVESAAKEA